jgi:hypothetical protein
MARGGIYARSALRALAGFQRGPIQSEWPVSFSHFKRILIQDTTGIGWMTTPPPCYPKGVDIENGKWAPALADFRRQNAES